MRFIDKSTARTIYKNYLKNSGVDDVKRSGRPSKMTERYRNCLRRILEHNKKTSAEKLRTQSETCVDKDYSTHFAQNGPSGPCCCKKIRITPESCIHRLLWAKQRLNKTVEDSESFVLGDEWRCSLKSDGRVYVWRTSGTRYNLLNTIEKSTSRFYIMFWG